MACFGHGSARPFKLDFNKRDGLFFIGTAQYPEMTDPDKTFWQDVHAKPADELHCIERHELLLRLVPVILIAERDRFVIDVPDSVIADGDLMGITAQVFDHALGVSEGAFGKYLSLIHI